jgi:hypothetical protein
MVSKTTEEGSSFLTDEEKDALLKEIKSIGESNEATNSDELSKDNT